MTYLMTDTESRQEIEARFYQCGDISIAIVAAVSKDIDWSAHIGTCHCNSEREAIRYALDYGCKLRVEDAHYYFPDIELPYRY